jgi:hypothetical protein
MIDDHRRLCDSAADPELARALREARGDVLSPDAVARVRAGLTAAGVVAAAAAAAGAARPLGGSVVAKVLAVIGVASLGIVGLAALRHTRVPQGDAAPSAPAAAVAAPASDQGDDPARASIPPLPAPSSNAVAVPEAAATSKPKLLGAGAKSTAWERDARLLLEARRALDTNPARALALVRQHEAEFPRSQLAADSAKIAAEATRRLAK